MKTHVTRLAIFALVTNLASFGCGPADADSGPVGEVQSELALTPAMQVTRATSTTQGSTSKLTFVLAAGSAVGVIYITKVLTGPSVAGRIDSATPPKAFLQVNPDEFNYLRGFVTQAKPFTVELAYDQVTREVLQIACETQAI